MWTPNDIKEAEQFLSREARGHSNNPYLERILDNGYGMVTGPAKLGIYVGTDMMATPPGWIFIPCNMLTANLLEMCYAHLQKGRDSWPKSNTGKKLKNMRPEEKRDWLLKAQRNEEYMDEVHERANFSGHLTPYTT